MINTRRLTALLLAAALTINGPLIVKASALQSSYKSINSGKALIETMDESKVKAQFSKEKLQELDNFINKEVEEGFPGAVLMVVKDGTIVKNTAYGYKKKWSKNELLTSPEKMTTDTMFDVASITKMMSTNLALQKLVSEGKLDIDAPVSKYIPEFKDSSEDPIKGKSKVTIRNVLNHTAGFAPEVRFFDNYKAGKFYSQDRSTTLKLIPQVPLTYDTGSKILYSDTDYMLLGLIIERITGMKQDEYVENQIYKPLGLKNTMYNPLKKGFNSEDTAATERNGNTRDYSIPLFNNIREYTLQGEVHDEKAWYSMGGVSGHAGLFSTAKDLAVLSQLILNGGSYNSVKIFDRDTLAEFTKPSDKDITYGLGWDRQGDWRKIWEFGPYASHLTMGHTGWTGCALNIDPVNNMAVILLTNMRHSPTVLNNFEGSKWETGRYGSIMSKVYEAFMENRETVKKDRSKEVTEAASEDASQVSMKFPEDDLTTRVFARNRRVFKGYKGRGNIIVENHGAANAELYVNGKKVDISKVLKDPQGKASIDISTYVVDGENSLKVLDIEPDESYLNVRVAYPELVKGKAKEAGINEKAFLQVEKQVDKILKDIPPASLTIIKNGKLIKQSLYEKSIKDKNSLEELVPKLTANLAISKLSSENLLNLDSSLNSLLPEEASIKDSSVTLRQYMAENNPDYALLIKIIEKASKNNFKTYSEENIYKPLGIDNKVNTETSLAVLSQTLLNRGGYGEVRLFPGETLDQLIKPSNHNSNRGYGWDRKTVNYLSYEIKEDNGTRIIIDPLNDMAVIIKILDKKNINNELYDTILKSLYETL